MSRQIFPKIKTQRFINGRFIRGPIPLNWILTAGKIGNKALELGCYMWFLAGLKDSQLFDLNLGKTGEEFELSRRSMQRALNALEAARLIEVTRFKGRKNRIKLLFQGDENGSTKPE